MSCLPAIKTFAFPDRVLVDDPGEFVQELRDLICSNVEQAQHELSMGPATYGLYRCDASIDSLLIFREVRVFLEKNVIELFGREHVLQADEHVCASSHAQLLNLRRASQEREHRLH